MTASPINAEESTGSWLGSIFEWFEPPENETIGVPKRRKSVRSSPTAASVITRENEAANALSHDKPAQPSSAVASVNAPGRLEAAAQPPARVVEFPKRREGMTPANVFQAVQDIIAEINLLREELGVGDYPPEGQPVDDRAPIHVYAKSLEILTKVVSVQQRMGVPAGRTHQIPLKRIDASDVLANLEHILNELRAVKAQWGIVRQIAPEPLETGKTFSMIYTRLSDASFMLDPLRGQPVTADDVYHLALGVLDEMVPIAERLDVSLSFESAPVTGKTESIDVARQLARATYKVVTLQTGLQMDSSGVPATTLVRVASSDHYDAVNMLLAEMTRIKLYLGINDPRSDRAEQPTGKSSKDVFALTTLIVQNLDKLALAVLR